MPSVRRGLFLVLLLRGAAAWAGDTPQPLPPPPELGVQVEKPAADGLHYWHGSGVYLGAGLVLTAAHVVMNPPETPKVTVLLDGRRTDGLVVRDGQADHLDLALIRIAPEFLSEKRRAQAAVPVCAANPGPSQPVVVAAEGTASNAFTVSTPITSDLQTGTWTDLLSTGFHQGSSGGAVFSLQQGCLWGIVKMEMSGPSITGGPPLDLTAFVPASKITPFLEAYGRQVTAPPR